MLLEAKGIEKSYNSLSVLKGIDMSIAPAEIVSIVGASGAGKSTLLQILGTLDSPDKGHVSLSGELYTQMSGKKLSHFRNEYIGFIFQFHNLLPEFTALENICMPAMIGKKDPNQYKKRAEELMELLAIEHRKDHKPSQMSGGEQQRAAVARALINNPKVIFADEPSGNLDSVNAESLHELFFDLRKELDQTFVIVTHNNEFAEMADRKLEMKDGLII
ncbi:ABC transporter ATP-binding protein [Sediminitomix flava]|uniref:Lipoprotein-releasing system ATP-binding protein n=1 Tax=Sediminitomix flava TaxID=379075 RepID=A0A315Z9U6_SEDFL|nr:ABC transporter ATP-binding protein [Sediminitomix flava]PWJ42346.1 lipoprotein-releasing system ATP-binding protein [Sediminitomix flava]